MKLVKYKKINSTWGFVLSGKCSRWKILLVELPEKWGNVCWKCLLGKCRGNVGEMSGKSQVTQMSD